jgi:hypothetical protein
MPHTHHACHVYVCRDAPIDAISSVPQGVGCGDSHSSGLTSGKSLACVLAPAGGSDSSAGARVVAPGGRSHRRECAGGDRGAVQQRTQGRIMPEAEGSSAPLRRAALDCRVQVQAVRPLARRNVGALAPSQGHKWNRTGAAVAIYSAAGPPLRAGTHRHPRSTTDYGQAQPARIINDLSGQLTETRHVRTSSFHDLRDARK